MEDMGMPIYVEVDATQVNSGISLLSSGTTGVEGGLYWINWTSDGGFTNQGWYYDECYLKTGWPLVAEGKGHTADQQGFLDYMRTGPSHLDDVLGGWDHESKWTFLQNHLTVFGSCTEARNQE